MLWDDPCFYIAADLEEPHVWATMEQRDAKIYNDNDFEVFIDPDGDTHLYYEFEINAAGTEWDLLLIKPYRDGAPFVSGWDMAGLRTAVHVWGTINEPHDEDQGLVGGDCYAVESLKGMRQSTRAAARRRSVAHQFLACAMGNPSQ